MWTWTTDGDGALVLEEFGDEATLTVRVFLAERAPISVLRRRSAEQRSSVPVEWEPETDETIAGLPAVCAVGAGSDDAVHVHVLADAGDVVVGVTLAERSGRPRAEGVALVHRVLGSLDVGLLRERARVPESLEVQAAQLVPWLLHPRNAAPDGVAVATLGNGVRVGVAALSPPFAQLLGPQHPWWADPGPEGLLGLARANLVRRMLGGEIPSSARSAGPTTALVLGPHALAGACLLLPDLGTWARGLIPGGAPLVAHLITRERLIVCPAGVPVDVPTWAPALPLLTD